LIIELCDICGQSLTKWISPWQWRPSLHKRRPQSLLLLPIRGVQLLRPIPGIQHCRGDDSDYH